MNRFVPANRNNQGRSLLNDHKNRIKSRPSLPKHQAKKVILTRAGTRQNKSPMVPTRNKSQESILSPMAVISNPPLMAV